MRATSWALHRFLVYYGTRAAVQKKSKRKPDINTSNNHTSSTLD